MEHAFREDASASLMSTRLRIQQWKIIESSRISFEAHAPCQAIAQGLLPVYPADGGEIEKASRKKERQERGVVDNNREIQLSSVEDTLI